MCCSVGMQRCAAEDKLNIVSAGVHVLALLGGGVCPVAGRHPFFYEGRIPSWWRLPFHYAPFLRLIVQLCWCIHFRKISTEHPHWLEVQGKCPSPISGSNLGARGGLIPQTFRYLATGQPSPKWLTSGCQKYW